MIISPSRPNSFGNNNSGSKKIFVIIAIIAVIAILALIFLIKGKSIFKKADKVTGPANQQEQLQQKTTNERIKDDLSKSTEFVGQVNGIQIPNDKLVVFLSVSASLIDRGSVDNTDFSQGSVEIKTEKKIFNVAVDGSTAINVPDKTDIKLGDFVRVVAPTSVYDIEKFTAVQVEVQKIEQ